MRVTVTYGSGNTVDSTAGNNIGQHLRNIASRPGATMQDVVFDERIQSTLGYGKNVEGHVGGIPQSATTRVFDGMSIQVYDKACEKHIS